MYQMKDKSKRRKTKTQHYLMCALSTENIRSTFLAPIITSVFLYQFYIIIQYCALCSVQFSKTSNYCQFFLFRHMFQFCFGYHHHALHNIQTLNILNVTYYIEYRVNRLLSFFYFLIEFFSGFFLIFMQNTVERFTMPACSDLFLWCYSVVFFSLKCRTLRFVRELLQFRFHSFEKQIICTIDSNYYIQRWIGLIWVKEMIEK